MIEEPESQPKACKKTRATPGTKPMKLDTYKIETKKKIATWEIELK